MLKSIINKEFGPILRNFLHIYIICSYLLAIHIFFMLFNYIKSKEKVSTIVESRIMNIRSLTFIAITWKNHAREAFDSQKL